MDDLISRKAVYEKACEGCTKHGDKPGECYHDEPCERLIFEFSTAPAVEAEPVRHGRLGISYIDEYYGEFADCQYCGTDNILPCNFCRNCGAKMDLEVLHET